MKRNIFGLIICIMGLTTLTGCGDSNKLVCTGKAEMQRLCRVSSESGEKVCTEDYGDGEIIVEFDETKENIVNMKIIETYFEEKSTDDEYNELKEYCESEDNEDMECTVEMEKNSIVVTYSSKETLLQEMTYDEAKKALEEDMGYTFK